jgi:ABC-type iron transport system FetAB ATPase subunit
MTMTYEEYLDEVTTVIYENYDVTESGAVKFVVKAQAAGFFVAHDDNEAMRTPEQAAIDADTIMEQRAASKATKPN